MARTSKAKKTRGQKAIRDTVKLAASDTTAVADAGAAFDPPMRRPNSVNDLEDCVGTSSSNAQFTGIDATKPRADSVSITELSDMATNQLLAELVSSVPSPKRVRVSVSSVSTNSHEPTLAPGSPKASSSSVEAWKYSGGAMLVVAFLVSLFMAWQQQSLPSVRTGVARNAPL